MATQQVIKKKIIRKPAAAPAPGPAPAAVPTTKAGKFAAAAEAAGWEVERKISGDSKEAVCTRGDETVTAEWHNEVAVGPTIGVHSYPGGSTGLKNAASAMRVILAGSGEMIPKPSIARKKPDRPVVQKKHRVMEMPFDPYQASDAELLEHIKGKRIVWVNSINPDSPEEGYVPNDGELNRKGKALGRHTAITQSRNPDTLGERIINFCDPGVGFRAAFVAAIIRIS